MPNEMSGAKEREQQVELKVDHSVLKSPGRARPPSEMKTGCL